MKYFPVKIVVNEHYHSKYGYSEKADLYDKFMLISKLVPVETKDITLGEFILKTLPGFFKAIDEDQPEIIEDDIGDVAEMEQTNLTVKLKNGNEVSLRGKVLVHGIEVDMDTSLFWMINNMAYMDNFLYISFNINKV